MKKLLIGLLVLGSLSAIADSQCQLVVPDDIDNDVLNILVDKGYDPVLEADASPETKRTSLNLSYELDLESIKHSSLNVANTLLFLGTFGISGVATECIGDGDYFTSTVKKFKLSYLIKKPNGVVIQSSKPYSGKEVIACKAIRGSMNWVKSAKTLKNCSDLRIN